MNLVVLIGRLTKDPNVNYTSNGKCVAQFTLAVDRPFLNQQGQKEADFIPIVLWGKTAELAGNSCAKGHRLSVTGRMQVRTYDNKQGQKVWVTEVIGDHIEFLEKKQETQGNGQQGYQQQGYQQQANGYQQQGQPQQGQPRQQYQQQDAFGQMGQQVPFDEEVPF